MRLRSVPDNHVDSNQLFRYDLDFLSRLSRMIADLAHGQEGDIFPLWAYLCMCESKSEHACLRVWVLLTAGEMAVLIVLMRHTSALNQKQRLWNHTPEMGVINLQWNAECSLQCSSRRWKHSEGPLTTPLEHSECIVHSSVECTYHLTDGINNSLKIMYYKSAGRKSVIFIPCWQAIVHKYRSLKRAKNNIQSFEMIVQDLQHPT